MVPGLHQRAQINTNVLYRIFWKVILRKVNKKSSNVRTSCWKRVVGDGDQRRSKCLYRSIQVFPVLGMRCSIGFKRLSRIHHRWKVASRPKQVKLRLESYVFCPWIFGEAFSCRFCGILFIPYLNHLIFPAIHLPFSHNDHRVI